MHEKNKRRKKLFERISDFCEIPQEAVSAVPVFVMRGKNEIEISGCTGILTYEEKTVVLSVGKDRFTVTGSQLELTDFREGHLCVRGEISYVGYGIADRGEGGAQNA